MPAKPEIPDVLTQKDWDKNKGTVAKLAGETGIGAAMKEIKTAYDAVDWNLFDAKMAMPGEKKVSAVEIGRKTAEAELKKVEAMRKKVQALNQLATKVETDFKKNKLIPASSTKHVGAIKTRADQWYIEMKDNSVFFTAAFKTFDELTKELEIRRNEATKAMKGFIASIAADAKEVAADPKVATYIGKAKTGFHQGVRGLSASLATQDDAELKKFYAKWKPYAQDSFKPTVDDEVKGKVGQVLNTLKELQAIMA